MENYKRGGILLVFGMISIVFLAWSITYFVICRGVLLQDWNFDTINISSGEWIVFGIPFLVVGGIFLLILIFFVVEALISWSLEIRCMYRELKEERESEN